MDISNKDTTFRALSQDNFQNILLENNRVIRDFFVQIGKQPTVINGL